jgi:hypothetical protein
LLERAPSTSFLLTLGRFQATQVPALIPFHLHELVLVKFDTDLSRALVYNAAHLKSNCICRLRSLGLFPVHAND